MPLDPTSPSVLFVRILLGESPPPDQLATLDPQWAELVEAAQQASPVARRAALVLAKAGHTDAESLLATLRSEPVPDAPWPEPIPFDRPSLPPFPSHVLPDWLGNFVRAEARATQTPPDLAGLLALAVLSTACAGRVVVHPWGDWLEPINLFLMVVLPPGHRKSAVFASVTQPLQQFEAQAAIAAAPEIAHARRQRHVAEQALQRAEHAAALAPEDDKPRLLATVERRADDLATIETPVVPRLIVDDCSPERLAMLLSEQGGRIAILSPEGGIFDLIAGRYSSTGAPNLDHFLKGHAGDPIVVDRVGRPGEIIPQPALTVGLTVQPEVLRHLIARPGFHGRGLLARFLYALPSSALGTRDVDALPVPDSLRDTYHRRILALLTASHLTPSARLLPQNPSPNTQHPPPVLDFSDLAAECLRDFARAVEPRLAPAGDLDPLVDWGSKLVGAVARLSALLHLAALPLPDRIPLSRSSEEGSDRPVPPLRRSGEGGRGRGLPPVEPDAVDAAVILADYLTEHARAAYAAMAGDPAIANLPYLLGWLRRAGLRSFTRRDAQRAARPRLNAAADLDAALDQLEQHGYIRQRTASTRPGPGRHPSPLFDVHPSLWCT